VKRFLIQRSRAPRSATRLNRYRLGQLAIDAASVALAWWAAFVLRFELELPAPYERLFEKTLPVVIVIQVAIFVATGLYLHLWRYISVRDMWAVVRAVALASVTTLLVLYLWNPVRGFRVPSAVLALDFLILLALLGGARLLARTIFERPSTRELVARGKEVIVVGAGDAGRVVIAEMHKNRQLGYSPIGLVDDNPRKLHMRLHGVRVLGSTHDLPRLLRDVRPDEVVLAIPTAGGETRERVVTLCREAGVPVKTLPGLYELISDDGADLARRIREVEVEDLLGREAVQLDVGSVAEYLSGETVLVTGAGGSIGSEICRQIVAVAPGRVVLVDNAETPLVDIQRELANDRGYTESLPVLADVANQATMRQLFAEFRPAVVFHGSAYKHVPLVEANPVEAVRNNVLATRCLTEVASEAGVKRFVLVSTDKAVAPVNVLGRTKALCEWIVAAADSRETNGTQFIAVRFGNVLGSSGSVIPLFRRQIAAGGPVTVTHEEMTRYFMTIPEAVQLVIQAGALGRSGDVFVLDMGKPVKILDLAYEMIRLSGKEPGVDVPVEIVGIRPGEKLHEVLWGDDEQVAQTPQPHILRSTGRPVDPIWLEDELAELERLVAERDTVAVVAKLEAMFRAPRRAVSRAPEMV
jgi:FlaA1/EpsC-like NDP-sugar epimerase